jgi:agmatinase
MYRHGPVRFNVGDDFLGAGSADMHDEISINLKSTDLAFTRKSPYGTLCEPTYAGALSFMRRRYGKDVSDADVAVVGIPFDMAVSNRPGARLGPRAVRAASAQLAWGRPYGWDFDPFDRLHVVDYGDCLFDPGHPLQVPTQIENAIGSLLDSGVTTLCLGGDHFISFPILKAYAARRGPLALIHFDAHCDTWREDEQRIDHGTMFYHAARLGLVDPARSVQIGMRTVNDEDHGYSVLDTNWVRDHGIEATIARIREVVGNHQVYVTFDIDVLDPSAAPGTGTPVVGGFTTFEAQRMVRGLAGLNIIGMDVVEVAPAYDVSEITALAAASIALDLLCAHASRLPAIAAAAVPKVTVTDEAPV